MPEDKNIERLIRPEILSFDGYSARKAPETLEGKLEVPVEGIIKLDANENPYGCSPSVNRALAAGRVEYNVYPDAEQTEIRKLLAEYTGAAASRIVASNGSNLLIDLVLRLFISHGEEVINCVPSFEMFRFSTDVCGGTVVEVPRDNNYNVNIEAVKMAISGKTRVILLANPNNPTGNLTSREDILSLLETGLPVIVDEAYYEFSNETVVPVVERYSNLMVLRTFSKWAGLAGLRIGYGIFPERIAELLMMIKIPYNVSVAAEVAVRESMKDMQYLKRNVSAIVKERDRMFEQLKKIKFLKPFPSRANFIFCTVLNGKASDIHRILQRKGIMVRYFNRPLLENSVRITVGKPEHTDALIKALQEAGEEING